MYLQRRDLQVSELFFSRTIIDIVHLWHSDFRVRSLSCGLCLNASNTWLTGHTYVIKFIQQYKPWVARGATHLLNHWSEVSSLSSSHHKGRNQSLNHRSHLHRRDMNRLLRLLSLQPPFDAGVHQLFYLRSPSDVQP